MRLEEVREILDAEVLTGENLLSREVTIGCGADLMSDVLAYGKSGSVLLTGLTNNQVVRTAEMADIVAICFVRGKKPDEKTVNMADSQGLLLLKTALPMFESCGRLYKHGLPGVSECGE
jgi:predicted transcriptional regulator